MGRILKAHEIVLGSQPFVARLTLGEPMPEPEDEEPVDSAPVDVTPQAEEILSAARADAERLIAGARQEAEALLEEAKKQALHSELDAYETGKQEGFEAGQAAGLASLDRLVLLAEQASVEWDRAVRGVEEQVVNLALTVAQHIVSQVAENDKQFVLSAVMQALDHLSAGPTVTVRVNPDDYDLLTTHWAETRGPNYRNREWLFVADREIERGGCVLEVDGGRIDAQPSTQMNKMRRALWAAGGFDDRAD